MCAELFVVINVCGVVIIGFVKNKLCGVAVFVEDLDLGCFIKSVYIVGNINDALYTLGQTRICGMLLSDAVNEVTVVYLYAVQLKR